MTGGKIYKPIDYHTTIVGQEKDTALPLQKVLVLTDDQYFYFKDITSGSCWLWIEAIGKWRQYQDTLVLDWKDTYWNPDSTILTTKYVFAGETLVYSDTCEENIFRNWDKFKLLKKVGNFKTDLKEDDDIATWVRSYAAYLECLKRYNWTKKFGKKYEAQFLLSFRRWSLREKLLNEEKWKELTPEEAEQVLNMYDSVWKDN